MGKPLLFLGLDWIKVGRCYWHVESDVGKSFPIAPGDYRGEGSHTSELTHLFTFKTLMVLPFVHSWWKAGEPGTLLSSAHTDQSARTQSRVEKHGEWSGGASGEYPAQPFLAHLFTVILIAPPRTVRRTV